MTRNPYLYRKNLWALLLAFWVVGCGKQDTTLPTEQPLMETVYASGYVHPANEYKVYAKVPGVLQRLLVQVNDTVRVGQILAQLDDGSAAVRQQNARLLYEMAMQNLKGPNAPNIQQLEREVATAYVRYQTDSLQLQRLRRLRQEQAITQSQLDAQELAAAASKNAYAAIQKRLYATRNDAQGALSNAQANWQLAAMQGADHVLVSQIAGMVYAINYEPGELVTQQQPVAVLGSPGQLELRLSVDEADIQRVRVGQRVLIELDSYPGEKFEGKVRRVHPMLKAQDQTFRVDVTFDTPLPARYAGLSAEANIVIQDKAKALVVPKEYLVGADSLRILKDGEPQLVRVKTGLRSLAFVEILSGIDARTELIKP